LLKTIFLGFLTSGKMFSDVAHVHIARYIFFSEHFAPLEQQNSPQNSVEQLCTPLNQDARSSWFSINSKQYLKALFC
jgi:hypothetical protein